jgi:hypothetical protein
MKFNFAALNWQHYVMWAATAIGAASAALASKASDLCVGAANITTCTSTITSVATTVGTICATLVFIFGHTSGSIMQKKDEGDADAVHR